MIKVTEREIFDILSGKISGSINRTVLKAFSREGIDITTEQWTVLSCLWDKDKIIQQVICDLTQKDKPSVTRLIDNLEKKNLVKRISDPADRRNNLIHLSSQGTALKQKTTRVVHGIVNHALEGISDDELIRAKNVLLRIMHNLEIY
ncbi:MAG: MarR family transcriptional regulator [Petrimonas sp.]|uniref:MarR family winged helix-turn-helix transcriptional regulator n=1 Tax=Petrimonas sp. TaxID=2023866 RepID=UPI002B3FFAF0|nr:MarR family transcriptional regulator [Petrimonas sp.]